MQPAPARDTDAIAWGWTWTAPRAELLALARSNCQVAAWLRFVRAPFWLSAGRDSIVVGDLRYDRDRRVGVAGYTFPASTTVCPASVPPWSPARLDVWPELQL
ncbi:MAG: hypothetical protein U5K74_11710 [Gemmatimonadaceae bacterium]|nr:hypothetical protein [Gemmatimonadaceae bacterium]